MVLMGLIYPQQESLILTARIFEASQHQVCVPPYKAHTSTRVLQNAGINNIKGTQGSNFNHYVPFYVLVTFNYVTIDRIFS